MSIFQNVLESVDHNRSREHNCIPFAFNKLTKFLPGIMQRRYYLVTANSGVGKTQFTDFAFLYSPFDFIRNNKTDISIKIFYYSLELSKDVKVLQGVCKRLYEKYGIITDTNQLQSFTKNRISQEIYDKVKECREYFESLEEVCTFYDDRINPYGIYREVDSYAKANGKIITKPITITENGISKVINVFDRYIPNKPNEYVMVVVDHVSLLKAEKGGTLHEAIGKFSTDAVELRNKYGYSFIVVQQQSAEKEKEQFTFKGQSIVAKLEPSLDGLGDNKLTQRDSDIALGLFDPTRHDIETYREHNIRDYGPSFRSLSILKNRYGLSNVHLPMRFLGNVNHFHEL